MFKGEKPALMLPGKRMEKNNAQPATPCFYWVSGFSVIIPYGHTYAVNALRSGDDIKTVQDTLGHHTAAFTLDVYGHVTPKMRQDSAARMEQLIQAIGGA